MLQSKQEKGQRWVLAEHLHPPQLPRMKGWLLSKPGTK